MKPREFEAQPFTSQQLAAARAAAAGSGRRLVACLEEASGLEPDAFTAALAATLGGLPLTMAAMHALEPAFDVLPYAEAMAREVVLLREPDGALVLAHADPFDARLRAWAAERIAEPFELRIAHAADISAWLTRQGESLRAMESVVLDARAGAGEDRSVQSLSLKSISEDASPIVRLVNSTLYDALKSGASDIHLESVGTGLHIKYRIDGVLVNVSQAPGAETAEQVISRVKVMAELDIAERRVPQDGRFKVSASGREIDFRVSIMPSIFGEDAVLRILDKQSLADQVKGLSLDSLGFDEAAKAWVRRLAGEPYGMLLVTGPTGSGKTTTLYASITEINHGHDKLITIEDPVEYQLAGVLQIPVNEKKGLTFARGLRSILRHDPDKIMVGEIRDAETAQIAIQAALTGHLVFTTVHANNVFDVIGRLVQMNVDPYSFTSACNAILAQRLLRYNCSHCAREIKPEPELLAESGITPQQATGFKFMAIAELLILDDEIRQLIVEKEPIIRIKERARAKGLRFLRETAVDLVRAGRTTLQEINRVTFVA